MACIQDVAREAGVSQAVVSAVLNGSKGSVRYSKQTRESVLRVSERLGYTRNLSLSYLHKGSTYSVGVMVFDLCDYYCAAIVTGMEKAFADTLYSILVHDTCHEEDRTNEQIELMRQKRVDGIVVIGCTDSVIQAVGRQAGRSSIPMIIVGTDLSHENVPSVICNQEQGAFDATVHLLDLGHRRVAGLFDQPTVHDSNERLSGMRRALEESRVEFDPDRIEHCSAYRDPFAAGYEGMQRLLGRTRSFSAVLASGDSFALGAIRALSEAGKAVPSDVSVVGFDDANYAAYANPPLTTVAQPLETMGRRAAEIFLTTASGSDGKPRRGDCRVVLEAHLKVRASTMSRNEQKPLAGGS